MTEEVGARSGRWGCVAAQRLVECAENAYSTLHFIGSSRPLAILFRLADYVGHCVGEVLSTAFGAISENRHSAMPKVGMLGQ